MGPRENPSMKQQIIDAVQKAGTLRTAQIAELIGKPKNYVSAYVSTLLRDGALIGCEVISDRGASTWEVRIAAGAGMAERHPWTPLRAPRGGAVHTTRIDDSPAARAAAAPKPARHEEPAPKAAAVVPPSREWTTGAVSAERPAEPTSVARQVPFRTHPLDVQAPDDQFRAGVFSDGALLVRNSAGAEIELSPAAAKRLALYLVRAQVITVETLESTPSCIRPSPPCSCSGWR